MKYSGMENKRCCRCKETLSLTCFHKNKSRKDGLDDTCKKCKSELSRAYHKKNKEKNNERTYKCWLENKESMLEKKRLKRPRVRPVLTEEEKRLKHNERIRVYTEKKRREQNKPTRQIAPIYIDGVLMKRCPKCKQIKEPTSNNFYNMKSTKDGLSNYCKPCYSNYQTSIHLK